MSKVCAATMGEQRRQCEALYLGRAVRPSSATGKLDKLPSRRAWPHRTFRAPQLDISRVPGPCVCTRSRRSILTLFLNIDPL